MRSFAYRISVQHVYANAIQSIVPSYTFSKSVYSYFHNFVSNFKKLCQYAINEFRDFASNVQLSGTYCDFLNKFIENEKTIAHRNCVYLLPLSCKRVNYL